MSDRKLRQAARWQSRIVTLGLATIPAVACVDLFHNTDFADPVSTAGDAGPEVRPPAPRDARSEANEPEPEPVDLCVGNGDTPLVRAEAACRLIGACGGHLATKNYAECVFHALRVFDCTVEPALRATGKRKDYWECATRAANAGSCAKLAVCSENSACFVPPTNPEPFTNCQGDTRFSCDGVSTTPLGRQSCSAIGKTCKNGSCVSGEFATDNCSPAESCGAGGKVMATCVEAVDVGVDCSQFGDSRCIVAGTAAQCTGASDEQADANSCSEGCDANNRSTNCPGGNRATTNCAALGFECKPELSVRTPSDRCTKNIPCNQDRCAGNTVTSCFRGLVRTDDCAAKGLGCILRSDGRDPKVATCTAPN
jgi:hypothetical protein